MFYNITDDTPLRLNDFDFWGNEGFGDEGGEVGHDFFDFGAACSLKVKSCRH